VGARRLSLPSRGRIMRGSPRSRGGDPRGRPFRVGQPKVP